MQKSLYFGACLAALALAGCSAASHSSLIPSASSERHAASSLSGRAGTMPAYYDGQLFTINFAELSPTAEQQVLQHNKSLNTIYMSDQAMAAGFDFVSVIDAIQGDGFNPLWQEVQIVFNTGVAPQQFTSDTAIEAAATAGLITLVPTTEVYRCSVIGPGKPK